MIPPTALLFAYADREGEAEAGQKSLVVRLRTQSNSNYKNAGIPA